MSTRYERWRLNHPNIGLVNSRHRSKLLPQHKKRPPLTRQRSRGLHYLRGSNVNGTTSKHTGTSWANTMVGWIVLIAAILLIICVGAAIATSLDQPTSVTCYGTAYSQTCTAR